MSFPASVRNQVFVKCARHCCACHQHKGRNIEIHHIIPKQQGGQDTFENAIALCFECHADAGHYFAGHPKGSKFSIEELRMHRDSWLRLVEQHQLVEPQEGYCLITIENEEFDGKFKPSFIKHTTIYKDRASWKRLQELVGIDPMQQVNQMKANNKFGLNFFPHLSKIDTYDDYLDYINGDHPNSPFKKEDDDENQNTDCQPLRHKMGSLGISGDYSMHNKSNCVLKLRFKNTGKEVLENYKLYLNFENILEADSVNKNNSWHDMYEYKYNLKFTHFNKAEFIPERDVLVQNDSVILDDICFRTLHNTKDVIVHWELFARNCHKTGKIDLKINPQIKREVTEKLVYEPQNYIKKERFLPHIRFT